jgi:hypothetical protein
MQPLDCGFFGPLKSAYSQECDAFIVNHAHQTITQRNLAGLFKRAYLRVATLNKAENSFRACGIYPFNPHVFSPEDFGPAQVSFVPNIAEKETNGSSAILQRDEASPKPSTSTNDAAPVNVPACGTSKEQLSSSSSSKAHVSPTILRPLPQAVVSKQRKRKANKSEILSGSPYKNSLEENIRGKTTEEEEKTTKGRRKVAKLYQTNKNYFLQDERHVSNLLRRIQDPPEEDWIQCHTCKE